MAPAPGEPVSLVFGPTCRSWTRKGAGQEDVQALAVNSTHLQNLLYADRRYKLLVLLQGAMLRARTAPCAVCLAA